MTRYLEVKPGSLSEVAIRLRDDYQAFFKKELEKTGKSIPQMTDAEKKAFFDKVDKAYTAKNEATSQDISQSLATKPKQEPKTTLVAAPGGKEKVIRIPVEKLADYKAKGYVEAEEFVPEQAKNPYAIGMAAAMKATGDKPPLKKSTIVKAHDIAKKIEKQEEEVKEQVLEEKPSRKQSVMFKKADGSTVHKYVYGYNDNEIENQIKDIMNKEKLQVLKKQEPESIKEETLEEGQYKEIDTRKGDLRLAKDKRQALKDKYNAIMANQASGDEHAVADQIQKLDMSIKKQEQELIDIMKKSKEKKEEVEAIEEAAGPDRLTNLNDKITRLQVNLQKLDKSKPESKTKEAILKSDLTTAKLRLQDLIQKRNIETKKEVKNEKMNYKSMKKSMKKEEETPKKTMTDKPLTKVDVDPKLPTH